MKTEVDDTIMCLNHLIETCRDGVRGFDAAAEEVKDPELRALFQRYSRQRESFVEKLEDCIRLFGGEPDDSGSLGGSLHRGWMEFKSEFASEEPQSVLAECERGEDAALTAYRKALDTLVEPAARELVSHQFASLTAVHDRVRDLRDTAIHPSR